MPTMDHSMRTSPTSKTGSEEETQPSSILGNRSSMRTAEWPKSPISITASEEETQPSSITDTPTSIPTAQWPYDIPSTPSSMDIIDIDLKDRKIVICQTPGYSTEPDQPTEPDRGQWSNKIEFYLTLIGYAVGLGNVWRFPYLVYINGGGVFLIPYTVALFIIGIPTFYMELLMGQYVSLGSGKIFANMSPIATGLGFAMPLMSFFFALYYNVILAWALFYIVSSFASTLPWATCDNSWNSKTCYTGLDNKTCEDRGFGKQSFFFDCKCHFSNESDILITTLTGAANEFFDNNLYDYRYVHGFNLGYPQWKLVLALMVAWLIVALCVMWGVKSVGKIVYFTATFPYVILIILVIRGATLEGAGKGIKFYLNPVANKLLSYKVWLQAATQIFYSLGPCVGNLHTLASFNKFNENCFKTAIIVSFINCSTSFFAGFAVFSTLGFIAHTLHKSVSDVTQSGQALAFITYPEAVAHMPVSQLWSTLFFLMLVTLALDTQFAMVDTIVITISDQFPVLYRYKWCVVQIVCASMCAIGISMTLQGGDRLLILLDHYSSSSLLYLGIFEILVVVYIYGIKRFLTDIRTMLGSPTTRCARLFGSSGWLWRIMWMVVTPIFMITILIISFIEYETPHDRGYYFTAGVEALGFLVQFSALMVIIGFGLYVLIRNRLAKRPLIEMITPTEDWGPAEQRRQRQMLTLKMKHVATDQKMKPPLPLDEENEN